MATSTGPSIGRPGPTTERAISPLGEAVARTKPAEWLRARGLSWLDLSGNADIHAPGLRIFVEGKPNRFASAGRPSTVFSPKAVRITRLMLVDPDRWWSQASPPERAPAHSAPSARA